MRTSNNCAEILQEATNEGLNNGSLRSGLAIKQSFRTTGKRRNLYHAGAKSDGVTVICSGWAFRFLQFPDGRRQILSVLIPGDLVSPIGVFGEKFNFSVQALTEVRSCTFSRAELQSRLASGTELFFSYMKRCVTDAERADSMLADLGRRSAAERVSRFILQLKDRLDERGLADERSFMFPLRQQHIADAVGLTTVHVSRVIGTFREAGYIEISKDQLTILNMNELRRIAEMK